MKQVSEAYRESMQSGLRNRSYVEVSFSNVDTTAPTDGAWESNGEDSHSEFATLDYDYEYQSPYATLELNRWALDGKSRMTPDSGVIQDGFISSFMSDENGQFATPAVLTREFSHAHTFPGLTLVFDSRCQEWPRSATVEFWHNGAVVQSETAAVNAETVQFHTKIDACDNLVITFGETLPYRRPRLERVLYGIKKVFGNEEIVSTKQSHDIDPITRRLPKETMQFVVLDYEHEYDPDNPSGIYEYIDKNSPVSIRFGYELPSGTTEWLAEDRYVLDSRPKAANNQATFSGTGLIGSMTSRFYKGTLGEKNFYELALSVLQDAGLTPTEQGANPWEIDESLWDMYTTAALPIDTHMNCLQLIAHACRCRLYTDDHNIIHIKPMTIGEDAEFAMDFTAISDKGQSLSKTEQLKEVAVSVYSYTAGNEVQSLYEGETEETLLHVEFSGIAQDVQITVTDGEIISADIYARAADLELSEGAKTIQITGTPLSESTVVVTYPVAADGEVDEEKNPLITNREMCAALAEHVAQYLQKRSTYDVTYRGNPELECGDVVSLQTPYTEKMNALILTDEITFNGSLSGKIKVKALQ